MYRLIVVGYDGSQEGRDALALAGSLASPDRARVVAAAVYPFDPSAPRPDLGGWGDYLREDAEASVADADLDLLPAGTQLERRVVPMASAAHGLHELAEQVEADLLVVGSTKHGTLGRILLGSTGESLLRSAPCAVAVAPRGFGGRDDRELRVIGVGYDGSPEAEHALATAEAVARRASAALRVITVVARPASGSGFGYAYADSVESAEARAQAQLDAALGRIGGDTRPLGIKRRGEPATVLSDEAEKGLDLLVVGSRGYGPLLRAVLGSVSSKLMRFASCPVLVVPRANLADRNGTHAAPDTTAVSP
jgi:nucleotide-binding universal stress UspA family protein